MTDTPSIRDTRTAQTVTLITIIIQCFVWILPLFVQKNQDNILLLQTVISIMSIWVYYLFSRYLRALGLEKTVTLVYVFGGCLAFSTFATLLNQLLFSLGSDPIPAIYYLSSFLSSGVSVVSIVHLVLMYMIGFQLMRFKGDYVGGLNVLGKLFIVRSCLILANSIYSFIIFFLDKFYSPVIFAIVGILSTVLFLAILGYMRHIYKKAEEYQEEFKEEDIGSEA